MENSASTNGYLDVMVEQLEMLAQKIPKKNDEVFQLQKENEKMAKQLEETWKQLINQVEKTFYEESLKTSREELFQLKTRVTNLKNEKKEIGEALVEVQKKNFHLEAQLTQDKLNHERLLKEIKKKIKNYTNNS